jgi:hypothetical protein
MVDSRVNRWLLVDANRWVVAGLLSLGVFVTFVALGWTGVIGVTAQGPATLLLSVLIAGNLTLVPITITINQLVLSREFGKPHDLRQRDQGVQRLREELRGQADVSLIPPAPVRFLEVLNGTIAERADAVYEAATETGDEETVAAAEAFRQRVTANTERMGRVLETAEFGSYELLAAMLRTNSAWLIEDVRSVQHALGEDAPDEPFDRMEETLRLFNVTRQYTKTLYAQKEVAALSRLLLYVGFVAVVVLSAAMLVYGAPLAATLTEAELLVGFSLGGALAFAPLAFLLSYTLRLSTVVSFSPLRNSFITDG